VIEQNRVPVLEAPEITVPLHPGLRNLAGAVAGLSATPAEQVSRTGPESKSECFDAAPPQTENAGALSPEAIRLEQAVQANERLEAVARELSIQVRELVRERYAQRMKLAGVFTLSAVLTVWALAATVTLMR
jgi:hypothetical protein